MADARSPRATRTSFIARSSAARWHVRRHECRACRVVELLSGPRWQPYSDAPPRRHDDGTVPSSMRKATHRNLPLWQGSSSVRNGGRPRQPRHSSMATRSCRTAGVGRALVGTGGQPSYAPRHPAQQSVPPSASGLGTPALGDSGCTQAIAQSSKLGGKAACRCGRALRESGTAEPSGNLATMAR